MTDTVEIQQRRQKTMRMEKVRLVNVMTGTNLTRKILLQWDFTAIPALLLR